MNHNNLLMLAVALSGTLLLGACNRTPDTTPAADATPPPAEPAPPTDTMPEAPAPIEPAPAATPTDSGLSFADMDKNKDGGVTQDELADTEMLHQHFSQADSDGDGKLSQAEVDKHRADMAAAPAE